MLSPLNKHKKTNELSELKSVRDISAERVKSEKTGETSEESDAENEFTNGPQFYKNIDLENDLDLLDPNDPLDRTMLKLISNNVGANQDSTASSNLNSDIEFDYDTALRLAFFLYAFNLIFKLPKLC